MISAEENNLLTQIGPETPCGGLLRRYWQPVALSEELPEGGAPVKSRPCGDLVRTIAGAVRSFEGEQGPADDITLLVARRV